MGDPPLVLVAGVRRRQKAELVAIYSPKVEPMLIRVLESLTGRSDRYAGLLCKAVRRYAREQAIRSDESRSNRGRERVVVFALEMISLLGT